MSEILKLGIVNKNNLPINEVNEIQVIANQGIVGDRHLVNSMIHIIKYLL